MDVQLDLPWPLVYFRAATAWGTSKRVPDQFLTSTSSPRPTRAAATTDTRLSRVFFHIRLLKGAFFGPTWCVGSFFGGTCWGSLHPLCHPWRRHSLAAFGHVAVGEHPDGWAI